MLALGLQGALTGLRADYSGRQADGNRADQVLIDGSRPVIIRLFSHLSFDGCIEVGIALDLCIGLFHQGIDERMAELVPDQIAIFLGRSKAEKFPISCVWTVDTVHIELTIFPFNARPKAPAWYSGTSWMLYECWCNP